MFEEGKDISSAEREFLEILGHFDYDNTPINKPTKRRIVGIFVKYFKKVKLKFIKNRVMKIRKKHGVYQLNDKQKELIAKIAGCFS